MVVVRLYIEGGVLQHPNVAAQKTLNNSQRFRESFYKLLTQVFDPNVFSIEIVIGGPRTQALNFFKSEITKSPNTYLLVDLDKPKSEKPIIIESFGLKNENQQKNIFFMVQEMEAWILSQPDKIEECYSPLKRIKPNISLSQDTILNGIDPESIVKPSKKLDVLLGRYFRYKKKGMWKKKNIKN